MLLSAVNIFLACIFWSWSMGYKLLVAGLTLLVTALAAFSPPRKSEETAPIVDKP